MLDYRPVFFVVGLLLVVLAVFMAIPAFSDFALQNPSWGVFALSAIVTLFFGVLLVLTNYHRFQSVRVRESFLLICLSWTILPIFGAMPIYYLTAEITLVDAVFESVSGLTTTGSTIITWLDDAPAGLLLWRSLLQWLGGIGIVVMTVAILPLLQVGGMQLFRMEFFEHKDSRLPRAAQIVTTLGVVYLVLTVACAISYSLAGMSAFDAMNHS
ncbi:MAG: potassium transporter TrkG, partial [Pseudomonadota bacterium]